MKILILRVSAIGDVIHTLPSLFYIKRCCPNAQISWVVQKKAAELLLNQTFLEQVHVLPDKFLHPKNWSLTLKVLNELKKTKWDAILDFQGIEKTSLLIWFLKGKKFGFAPSMARSKFSTWFTDVHVNAEFKNIIQKNLALASEATQELCLSNYCPAIQELKKDFKLNFNIQEKTIVEHWLSSNQINNFILLCPNTSWTSKHWPEEYWVELIENFAQKNLLHKILIVGQHFGTAAENIAQKCQEKKLPVFIIPNWNLNATAYLISKSDLVIAPDTGLLHLADFLDVKTVGIFGPTSKDLQGPFLKNENISNAIQVYDFRDSNNTNRSNFQKTTSYQNNMYKLKPCVLIEKVLQILKTQN